MDEAKTSTASLNAIDSSEAHFCRGITAIGYKRAYLVPRPASQYLPRSGVELDG
jgi:hypothetical protein